MRRCIVVTAALFLLSLVYGQQPASLSKEVQKYVRVQGARVVLTHVRIIDGTGRAPTDDQNVVLEGGEITAIQPGADMSAAKDTTVLDLRGYTVIPGIVGMHNHLFYAARPNLDGQWHGNPPPADDVLGTTSLSCWRRDHDAHDGQRRTLCRPEPQT